MAATPAYGRKRPLEIMMRFAPAAAALSLALALTASVSWSADRAPAPHAAALLAQGDAALRHGDVQGAIDAYESALAIDPGYAPVLLKLAEAARKDGLQGKAIGYYREALDRDPRNFAAIAGEGEALVERGALEKARGNLAKLESLCGQSCPETAALTAAIAAGPKPRILTADATMPESKSPQAN
ncbi:tetratricopeptide repeat protein [Erythrobacter mangrovi]|nr:tetratricopeptide repeat protein [Erythrobacter mangrovi]